MMRTVMAALLALGVMWVSPAQAQSDRFIDFVPVQAKPAPEAPAPGGLLDGMSDQTLATVLGAAAGASLGTEVSVILLSIVLGSTASWWLLGGAGFVAGGLVGGVSGRLIADAFMGPPPKQRERP